MMFKKLQKKLDLNWTKKNNIWDVVVYGSFARGKLNARDIDIAIILKEATSANQKMLLCQQLRRMLAIDCTLDVKAVDINDFLNAGFLGREAILAEGRSLINKKYLAEEFGFSSVALIEYRLRNLTLAKQKTWYYALQGRKKGTGILPKLGGRIISKGVLEVPTKNYEEIKAILDLHKVECTITFNLKYRILH